MLAVIPEGAERLSGIQYFVDPTGFRIDAAHRPE
jgi:hypothetical protein